MDKRTRNKLIIFFAVAILYFAGMIFGKMNGSGSSSANAPQNGTSVQTEAAVISSSGTANAAAMQQKIPESQTVEGTQKKEQANGQVSVSEDAADSDSDADTDQDSDTDGTSEIESEAAEVVRDGQYTDKEHVALYIHTFGKLPSNFITKNKARDAGWDSAKGNLNEVCPGKSIGGSKFGNHEGRLPDKKGRQYFECDINYDPDNGYRGGERIIYSNDGLVYYSEDHYENFELLYGEP